MLNLYFLSYFSTVIAVFVGFFAAFNGAYLLTFAALIFPLFFYYYVSFPVLKKGFKKLSLIRKNREPLVNYYAVFNNIFATLIPFNIISRDTLVALVN